MKSLFVALVLFISVFAKLGIAHEAHHQKERKWKRLPANPFLT